MKKMALSVAISTALIFQFLMISSAYAKRREHTPNLVNQQLRLLEDDLNDGSSEVFLAMLDLDEVLDTALRGLDITPQFGTGFRKSIKNQKRAIGEKLISQLQPGGYAKIVKIHTNRGTSRALLRLDFINGGFSFMSLQLRIEENSIFITDWYDYTYGQRYSDSLRQIVAMAAPSANIIARVFDILTDQNLLVNKILQLIKLGKEGNYNKLHLEYTKLNEKYKEIRIFMLMMSQFAAASGNEPFYKEVLADIAQFHGDDPRLTFLLLDHFYYSGKYDKCLSMIDDFIKEINVQDEAALSMKANLLIESGKYDSGVTLANQVIEKTPNFDFAYWVLLNGQVLAKDYKAAITTVNNLESTFGYVINKEMLGEEPLYEDFINSQEFSHWITNKPNHK